MHLLKELFRPFFKKSETFHTPSEDVCKEHNISYNPDYFGKSGPIHISYSTEFSPSHRLWHQTLNQVGVKTNEAHVGGTNVGVWTSISAVDPDAAERCYSTRYCSASLPNLHILTGVEVLNVELKEGGGEQVATGVRFASHGRLHTIGAGKEVIISAGTVKSPLILEQSGIGNEDVLAKANIPVKVSSPMVGENLQDHLSMFLLSCLLGADSLMGVK
jgi:choline dehydrogenase-like flavoprotein